MGINEVPSGERIHIGFFGRRNAGKSSLVNKITNQNLSLVSDIPGTTTDPVKKAMELLPLGPVVIIDTPGFDDSGELGAMRVEQTKKALEECDIAVLAVSGEVGLTDTEKELVDLFNEKEIDYILCYTKSDLKKGSGLSVSSKTGEGIEELKEKIAALGKEKGNKRHIVGDILKVGDKVVLVIPIDEAAPKGRLILPQVQTIREILDAGASALCVRDTEYKKVMDTLDEVRLVITDSQVFSSVQGETDKDIPLTSFSILMARYKGTLNEAVMGAKVIDLLKDGDEVLIAEACTHHRQCGDIGSVKIPALIKKYTGKDIKITLSSGKDFPSDLEKYKLIIHCGGCMATEKEMEMRLKKAKEKDVAMTNYGISIAYMNGILERSISPIPEMKEYI